MGLLKGPPLVSNVTEASEATRRSSSLAGGVVVSTPPRAVLAAYRVRGPISSRYLIGRLVNAALTVWGVFTIVFFALHLTGNPAALLVSPDATPRRLAGHTRQRASTSSLAEQYFIFIGQVLTGHYPESIRYGVPPLQIVFQRFPATLLLGATGLAAGVVLGLLAGFIRGVRADSGRCGGSRSAS